MKKIFKLFGKWMIAGMGLLTGVILVYAATTVINSVTNQTINKGDQIGSGWFQEVNDKVNEISNNISGDRLKNLDVPVNGNEAATKSYVDTIVSAAGGAYPGSIDWRDCETHFTNDNETISCSSGYTIVDHNCYTSMHRDGSNVGRSDNFWCKLTDNNSLKLNLGNSNHTERVQKAASIKCCKIN